MSESVTIEHLYSTFRGYTTSNLHYCDCGCIDLEDVKKLASKPLRHLAPDDLVSYHGSALYTWGEVEHYKHFLPRVLELYAKNRDSSFIDLYEVYGKLAYAEWDNWPEEETKAILNFVRKDWTELINDPHIDLSIFHLENYSRFIPFPELIEAWDITKSSTTLRHFVTFFYFNGTAILNDSIKINEVYIAKELIQLLDQKGLVSKLEEAYFAFENIDQEYADKISIVLQMIEQELKNKK